MDAFDDFYRRNLRLNTAGLGIRVWRRAKKRDSLIWKAALERVLEWYKEYDELDWNMVACLIQKNIKEELKDESI